MIFTRSTVAQRIEMHGVGLHSGTPVEVFIHPYDKGIVFRHGNEIVRADPTNVTDTQRCTKLGSISTIEHLMAAFAGLEITDALVEVSSPELPAADGCSRPFCDAILAAGIRNFGHFDLPPLFRRLFLQESSIKIAVGKGTGQWRYEYETGSRWPGSMHHETQNVIAEFSNEIAPARTFAHAGEIPALRAAGLAKGLDETSALIVGDAGYQNTAKFLNEPARHKLLDLMGDLYLSGVPVKALNVVGTQSGHRTNIAMAMMLFTAMRG